MVIMTFKTCYVCQCRLPNFDRNKSSVHNSSVGGEKLRRSIQDVVFINQILFKVPNQVVLVVNDSEVNKEFLGRCLELCETCSEAVEHAKSIYRILLGGVGSFRKVQARLVEKVKKSQWWGKKDNISRGRRSGGLGSVKGDIDEEGLECKWRKYVSECDYGSDVDSFSVDQLAVLTNDLEKAMKELTASEVITTASTNGVVVKEEEMDFDFDNTENGTMDENVGEESAEDSFENFDDGESEEEDDEIYRFHNNRVPSSKTNRRKTVGNSCLLRREPPPSGSKHYRYQHICLECGKSFTRPHRLRNHMSLKHGIGTQSQYNCNDCGRSYNQLSCLRTHEKQYKGICINWALKDRNDSKNGTVDESVGKEYAEESVEKFDDGESGKEHDETNQFHNKKVPTSKTRPRKATRNSLRVHRESLQPGAKPYHYQHLCEECGKSFTRPHRLRDHMALKHGIGTHSKYICSDCGRSYYQLSCLRSHEKQYKGICINWTTDRNYKNK